MRRWITGGDGIFVYSTNPSYAAELAKNPTVKALLQDFAQRGRALRIDPRLVEVEEQNIPPRPVRRSNDPHILALAWAGKATVLFSCDFPLHEDFRRILPKVGQQQRSSFPLKVKQPEDITDSSRRRKFLELRKCTSRH